MSEVDLGELGRLEAQLKEIRKLLEGRLPVAAVTFTEAARLLSVSPKHIGRMARSGQIHVSLVGGVRRITTVEIQRILSGVDLDLGITRRSPSTASRTAKSEAAAMRAALKRR